MDETVKFLDTMREILAKESIDQSKHIFIGRNKKTQNSIKISLSSKDFDHKLNEWKYVYLMSQTKNHIKYENDSKELLKETEAIIQSLASDEASDICLRINDSIKANYQRHESAAENLEEIHNLLNKIIQQKENYKNFTLNCNSTNSRKFS